MFRDDDIEAVVFVGGGHAHLHSLLRTSDFTERGCKVTLVNPSPYLYYSGMATGVISGAYTPEQDRIDVRRLVERGGGSFVQGRVTGVVREQRELLLEDGGRVGYDLASLCLGSEVATGNDENDEKFVIPVKPVENTVGIRNRILSYKGRGSGGPKVVVIGGGAAGCEVAANTANLMNSRNIGGRILIVEDGPFLLGASPNRACESMSSYLEDVGVEVLLNTTAVSYGAGGIQTGDGRRIEADLVVPAVGIVPRNVGYEPSVLTGEDGGLWVGPGLRSVSDPRLFGGGDSISFRGGALPRLGVFGIRQGPVLFRNLLSAVDGKPLETFEPQERYLYVLNLGDGTGLAIYGSFSWRGRAAMILKHRIDQNFVRQYDV